MAAGCSGGKSLAPPLMAAPEGLATRRTHTLAIIKRALGRMSLALLVGIVAMTPGVGWGQGSDQRLQQLEKRITDKQQATEAHRKQLETLKDPAALNTEMRRHFQMTEEILALMLERRKMMGSDPGSGGHATPAQPAQPSQGRAMQGRGHGMAPQGQSGGMMEKEMGDMKGGLMSGSPASPPAGATPGSSSMTDIDQMMKRIMEHSAYMETLKNDATLRQEIVRHQKMLDQMLQLLL